MKDVYYALANLVTQAYMPEADDEMQRRLAEFLQAARRTPGPRLARIATILSTLAVDAPAAEVG